MLRSWKTQAIRSETQSSIHRLDPAALIWTRVRQFDVSSDPGYIQMIPKQPPWDTVVLQVDPHTGVMQLTCPICHPGLTRRGHFKIEQGCIVSLGNFVGQPQPADEPMTPEQFSEFVLKPLLFPQLS